MIVAGSILAMLLMGLAVDGFVNPADEENDDTSPELEAEEDLSDPSDEGTGLTDLLSANDPAPEPLGYSALDEIEPETQEEAALTAEEDHADDDWTLAEASRDFVDVHAVTAIESGEDIPYVEAFDTGTDTLVLEFEGTAADVPEIDVTYDSAEDAALVLANGLPVTLVEGASEMTTDHVRIVMSEEDALTEPQVLPAEDEMPGEEETMRDPGLNGPQTLSLPTGPEPITEPAFDRDDLPRDPGNDDAQTLPISDDIEPTVAEDLSTRDPGTDGPQTLAVDETLTQPGPNVAEARDLATDGPQTQITSQNIALPVEETVEDTVTDVVDTITDGVPGSEAINAIMDQVTGEMYGIGGIDEMLDARTGMDDAFGTGGNDALTGTFNDDLLTGGPGQDALFGDEGDDTLQGGAGNDELHGDFGNDLLEGGSGVDFLDGGEGDDMLDGGGDRDLLFGGDGDDVLYGGAADDFLSGGMGSDMLDGGSGNDVLDGTFGTDGTDKDDGDVLWGGTGDDTLILGAGDVAHGGDGADTFVSGSYVENAEVAGRVEDFDPGEDRIEVIFDASQDPDPTLEVQDFADGSGADIILNGEVILSVAGAQGLDPNMIELRSIA